MKQSNLSKFFSLTPLKNRGKIDSSGGDDSTQTPSFKEKLDEAKVESSKKKENSEQKMEGKKEKKEKKVEPAKKKDSAKKASKKMSKRKRSNLDDLEELYEFDGDEEEDSLEIFDDDEEGNDVDEESASANKSDVSEGAVVPVTSSSKRITADEVFPSNEKVHKAFVKRLRLQDKEGEEDGDDSPSFDNVLASTKRRKNVKYTPLENQFLEVKEKHQDVILFVECGYKYKFFASDAIIASKVLQIVCFRDKNFYCATVPVGRLEIHMERLVVAGHKVGVMRQTETAALKQGNKESKNQIFTRELCDVYTTATFLGDQVITQSVEPMYMMAIADNATESKVSFVAISLRTSDITYETFADNTLRRQLETRLVHINPVEILLPPDGIVSKETETMVKEWTLRQGGNVRLTRSEKYIDAKDARQLIAQEYKSNEKLLTCLNERSDSIVSIVASLGNYLKQFKLERSVMLVDGMREWTLEGSSMLLPAETLRNLEVFKVQATGKSGIGTLFHLMNQTVSAMGSRLLAQWISHPLLSVERISERLDAVEAFRNVYAANGNPKVKGGKAQGDDVGKTLPLLVRVIQNISRCGDLEQDVAAIYYRRSKPAKFVSTLKSLSSLIKQLKAMQKEKKNVSLIQSLLDQVFEKNEGKGSIEDYIDKCLAYINEEAASSSDWKNLFMKGLDEEFDEKYHISVGLDKTVKTIQEAKQGAARCEKALDEYLSEVRLILNLPKLQYKTVLNREYLIEVPKSNKAAVKAVPKDWDQEQSTKAQFRFVSPVVAGHLQTLNMYREAMLLLSKKKWELYQQEFTDLYPSFRRVIHCLSSLDCLSSLAVLASNTGYVRPMFAENKQILAIEKGRHAVSESLCESFIGNDVLLDQSEVQHMIITGPNMGGKSTFIRGSAMIAIMAQCGSFVPADKCTTGIFDAVYTRMGAEDDIIGGKSTFYTELVSAGSILDNVTSKSLVIIDELGRGTSTFDGTAIAYATLKHLAESVQCLSFFVTHYPSIGALATTHKNIANYHVAYVEGESEEEPITFLFQVKPGLETRSYGLNCARLVFADTHENILKRAREKSREMEDMETERLEEQLRSVWLTKDKNSDKKRARAETGEKSND